MKYAVLLLMLMMLPAAAALDYNPKSTATLIDDIPMVDRMLIKNPEPLPTGAERVISDERILLQIGMDDGSTQNLGLVIEDAKLKRLISGEFTDYGYSVEISQQTLDKILASENMVSMAAQHVLDDKISFHAHTFWKKVKLTAARPIINFVLRRLV